MKTIFLAFLIAGSVSCIGVPAHADERLRPLMASGDWIAMAHSPSMLGTPDVCLALNISSHVAFRASVNEDLQFRVTNDSWSLPTGVEGDVTLSLGDMKTTLKIFDNTDNMIIMEVPEDVYPTLFTAMDKSSLMVVGVGKAKPISVSLAGSTKVMNAFRTCAHIRNGTQNGGNNPFR